MRTLVIGDIHGNFKGLRQSLERSQFDYENDELISLGDLVDGHSESFEVIEELLKIKNLISIRGNHDDWFLTFLTEGEHPANWTNGAKATGMSYLRQHFPDNDYIYDYSTGHLKLRLNNTLIPESHIEFFKNQIPYFVDKENRLFVHGGFNRHHSIEDPIFNDPEFLMWDRDLWGQALSYGNISAVEGILNPKFKMKDEFKDVFIGHTTTTFWKTDKPMNAANVWNLDTGGGYKGKITIMDVNTKEYWQSDLGSELYPEFKGR